MAEHLARVALHSAPPGAPGVRMFDDTAAATLVAAAPEAATRIARQVLGRLLEMRRGEQPLRGASPTDPGPRLLP